MQLMHLIGFIFAFAAAVFFYDDLAKSLQSWFPSFAESLHLDTILYNVLGFAIIFFAVKVMLSIIASIFDFIAKIPIIKSINKLLGGVFGFLEHYLILFIVLYIAAYIPAESLQLMLQQSSVSQFILNETPYFSEKVLELFSA